ncbi:MAG TPA: MFS transporter [Thermomicrobiales bacterium]|nr:MFS transporter [Thermomicrobiales bacterium]
MNESAIPRTTWLALAVLLSGAFMALLDTTIVNVAIPTIRTDLDASEATLSWIISGYALAFGLMLIPAGRVGDRFGHKWTFIVGLAIFTLSSFACGRAQTSNQLVAARVVQGIGGGIYYTSITALIQLMFFPHQRGRAFGYLAAVIGFATALGPLVGGLIIEYAGTGTGWRLIFDVNIPIGIVAMIAAFRVLPSGGKANRLAVDPLGLALLTAALVALLVPLIMGQDRGWPLWTVVSLASSVVLLVVFAVWELRVARSGGSPLVPPRLFEHWSFTGGALLAMVYFAAFTGIFFAFALLWQVGLGHSALDSGLLVMPFAVGSILGASQSDKLARRYGRASLTAGVGVVAAALFVVFLILTFVDPVDLNRWQFLPPLFIGGIGSGIFIAPNVRFIVATVDREDAGAASGVLGTVQRIGSAIGIAVIGSVLFGTLHFEEGPNAVANAFGQSTQYAIGVSVILTVIAFLLAFAVPGAPEDATAANADVAPDVG